MSSYGSGSIGGVSSHGGLAGYFISDAGSAPDSLGKTYLEKMGSSGGISQTYAGEPKSDANLARERFDVVRAVGRVIV